MIISIAGQRNGESQQIIDGIIAQRRRAARKVMLLDPSAGTGASAHGAALSGEVEKLLGRCNDVVINITGCAADVYRPALISAQLVIVLLHVDEARLDKEYNLIAQLNAARMFNPGLHVVFAVIAGESDPTPEEIAAVRVYCAEVMSARPCGIVIETGANFETGLEALCKKVFEQQSAQAECALH